MQFKKNKSIQDIKFGNTKKGLTNMNLYEAYKSALEVQSACNLLGVIRSFVLAMDAVKDECNGTEDRNTHPIAILYSSKIESLTGSGNFKTLSDAWDSAHVQVDPLSAYYTKKINSLMESAATDKVNKEIKKCLNQNQEKTSLENSDVSL
jgi:hypothetical protein